MGKEKAKGKADKGKADKGKATKNNGKSSINAESSSASSPQVRSDRINEGSNAQGSISRLTEQERGRAGSGASADSASSQGSTLSTSKKKKKNKKKKAALSTKQAKDDQLRRSNSRSSRGTATGSVREKKPLKKGMLSPQSPPKLVDIASIALRPAIITEESMEEYARADARGRDLVMSNDKTMSKAAKKAAIAKLQQRSKVLRRHVERMYKSDAQQLTRIVVMCPHAHIVLSAVQEIARRAAAATIPGASEDIASFPAEFERLRGLEALCDFVVHYAWYGLRRRSRVGKAQKGQASSSDAAQDPAAVMEDVCAEGGEPLLYAILVALANLSSFHELASAIQAALNSSASGAQSDDNSERDLDEADLSLWKAQTMAWATQLVGSGSTQGAKLPPPAQAGELAQFLLQFEQDMVQFMSYPKMPKMPAPLDKDATPEQYKDFMRAKFDTEEFDSKVLVAARKMRSCYSAQHNGKKLIDQKSRKSKRVATGFPTILVKLCVRWLDMQRKDHAYALLSKEMTGDGSELNRSFGGGKISDSVVGDSDVVIAAMRVLHHVAAFGGASKAVLSSPSCLQFLGDVVDGAAWARTPAIGDRRQREALVILAATAVNAQQASDPTRFGSLLAESGTLMACVIRLLYEENNSQSDGLGRQSFSITRLALFLLQHALRNEAAREQFVRNRGYYVFAHVLRTHCVSFGGENDAVKTPAVVSEFNQHVSANVILLAIASLVHQCVAQEHAVELMHDGLLPYALYAIQAARDHFKSHMKEGSPPAVGDFGSHSCSACQEANGPFLIEYVRLLFVLARVDGSQDALVAAAVPQKLTWLLARAGRAYKNPSAVDLQDDGVFFDPAASAVASRALAVILEFTKSEHVGFSDSFYAREDSGEWVAQQGMVQMYRLLSSMRKIAHRATASAERREAEIARADESDVEDLRAEIAQDRRSVEDAINSTLLVLQALQSVAGRGQHMWRVVVHASNAKMHPYLRSVLNLIAGGGYAESGSELRVARVTERASQFVLSLLGGIPSPVDGIPVAVAFLRCISNPLLLARLLEFLSKACYESTGAREAFASTKEIRWIHRSLIAKIDKTFRNVECDSQTKELIVAYANYLVKALNYDPAAVSASSKHGSSTILAQDPGVDAKQLLANYGQAISNLKHAATVGVAQRSTISLQKQASIRGKVLEASEKAVETAGQLASKLHLSEKKTNHLLKSTRRTMHLAIALLDEDSQSTATVADLDVLVVETWSWIAKVVTAHQERLPASARSKDQSTKRLQSLQTLENEKELREIARTRKPGSERSHRNTSLSSSTMRVPRRRTETNDTSGAGFPVDIAALKAAAAAPLPVFAQTGTSSDREKLLAGAARRRGAGSATVSTPGGKRTHGSKPAHMLPLVDSPKISEDSTANVIFDPQLPQIAQLFDSARASDRDAAKAGAKEFFQALFAFTAEGETAAKKLERELQSDELDAADPLRMKAESVVTSIQQSLPKLRELGPSVLGNVKTSFSKSADANALWELKAILGQLSEATMALRHSLQLYEYVQGERKLRREQEAAKQVELAALASLQASLPPPIADDANDDDARSTSPELPGLPPLPNGGLPPALDHDGIRAPALPDAPIPHSEATHVNSSQAAEPARTVRPHARRQSGRNIGTATLRRGIKSAEQAMDEIRKQSAVHQTSKAFAGASSSPAAKRSVVASPDSSLPPKWRAAVAPDGRQYYYHVETQETTWEKPILQDTTEVHGVGDVPSPLELSVDVSSLPPPVDVSSLPPPLLVPDPTERSLLPDISSLPPPLTVASPTSKDVSRRMLSPSFLRSSSSDMLANLPASPRAASARGSAAGVRSVAAAEAREDVWLKLDIDQGHFPAPGETARPLERMLRVGQTATYVAIRSAIASKIAEATGESEAANVVAAVQLFSRDLSTSDVINLDSEDSWRQLLATVPQLKSLAEDNVPILKISAVLPAHSHGSPLRKDSVFTQSDAPLPPPPVSMKPTRPALPETSTRLPARRADAPLRSAPAPPPIFAPPPPAPVFDNSVDVMGSGFGELNSSGLDLNSSSMLDEIEKGPTVFTPKRKPQKETKGLLDEIAGFKGNTLRRVKAPEKQRKMSSIGGGSDDFLSAMAKAMDQRRMALHEKDGHDHAHGSEAACESDDSDSDSPWDEADLDDWM